MNALLAQPASGEKKKIWLTAFALITGNTLIVLLMTLLVLLIQSV